MRAAIQQPLRNCATSISPCFLWQLWRLARSLTAWACRRMRALPPVAIIWTRCPRPSAWQNRSMFTTDELKRSKLCSVLGETELARFAEMAADVRLAPGEWLIREGEPPWFYVLFEGKLRIVNE